MKAIHLSSQADDDNEQTGGVECIQEKSVQQARCENVLAKQRQILNIVKDLIEFRTVLSFALKFVGSTQQVTKCCFWFGPERNVADTRYKYESYFLHLHIHRLRAVKIGSSSRKNLFDGELS